MELDMKDNNAVRIPALKGGVFPEDKHKEKYISWMQEKNLENSKPECQKYKIS